MKAIFALVLFLIPSVCFAANPVVTGTTGTLSNGNTITVSGSNFQNVPSPNSGNLMDDFTIGSNNGCMTSHASYQDGFCRDADSESPGQPVSGSKWTWDNIYFQFFTSDDGHQTVIDGEPLLGFRKTIGQFSTGYGGERAVEYHTDGVGRPDSNIYFTVAATEMYFVAYVKYDSDWDTDWNPCVQDKFLIFYFDEGTPCKDELMMTRACSTYWGGACTDGTYADHGFYGECGVSGIGQVNSYGSFSAAQPGSWHEYKWHIGGGTSGYAELWINGQKALDDSSMSWGSNENILYVRFFGNVQDYSGQFTMPGSGNELIQYFDDVMIWTSDQTSLDSVFPVVGIVYISNQSTWGSGPTDPLNGDSNYIRQVVGGTDAADLGYKSWTDTGLKFIYNDGSLEGPLYLYVWSFGTGEMNASGYALSGGSASGRKSTAEYVSGGMTVGK